MSKIQAIAMAICKSAGMSVNKTTCVMCANGSCSMWKEFKDEARAAVKAYENYKEEKS